MIGRYLLQAIPKFNPNVVNPNPNPTHPNPVAARHYSAPVPGYKGPPRFEPPVNNVGWSGKSTSGCVGLVV